MRDSFQKKIHKMSERFMSIHPEMMTYSEVPA